MKIALLLALLSSVLGQSLVVQTEYGAVKGRNLDNVANAWLGIRFAADPSGESRFRPPTAPEPWDFVMDCTRWGAACPQVRTFLRFSSFLPSLFFFFFFPPALVSVSVDPGRLFV